MVLTINKLWKSVQNLRANSAGQTTRRGPRLPPTTDGRDAMPRPLCACSACAGDYEDPDRTAGTDDEDIEPEDSEAEDDGSRTE